VRSFCHRGSTIQLCIMPTMHPEFFSKYGLMSHIFLIFISNLIHIINLPMFNIMIDQLFKLSPAGDGLKKVVLAKKVQPLDR